MTPPACGAPSFVLDLPRGRTWRIGPRPAILGILNLTPDSFSDGGQYREPRAAVAAGLRMVREGAGALDLGAESTRPGARAVAAEDQLRRLLPVLSALRAETDVPLSVDTRDPRVGEAALEAGADIINDVSACSNPAWIPLLRGREVPVILMHMRGTPEDMQEKTDYPRGVVREVLEFLERRLEALRQEGIEARRTIVDPGIGFAKEPAQNLELLAGLGALRRLGRPILLGASRKFFLGKLLSRGAEGGDPDRDPRARDVGTVAANTVAVLAGASILRVHNVAFTRDLVDVLDGLRLVLRRLPSLSGVPGGEVSSGDGRTSGAR